MSANIRSAPSSAKSLAANNGQVSFAENMCKKFANFRAFFPRIANKILRKHRRIGSSHVMQWLANGMLVPWMLARGPDWEACWASHGEFTTKLENKTEFYKHFDAAWISSCLSVTKWSQWSRKIIIESVSLIIDGVIF